MAVKKTKTAGWKSISNRNIYCKLINLLHRLRLEYFEQSCSIDSVTKKCAGSPSECRLAMLGILGTDLRMTCVCKGNDLAQVHKCLGWHRLLWVNPCVGKFHGIPLWINTLHQSNKIENCSTISKRLSQTKSFGTDFDNNLGSYACHNAMVSQKHYKHYCGTYNCHDGHRNFSSN